MQIKQTQSLVSISIFYFFVHFLISTPKTLTISKSIPRPYKTAMAQLSRQLFIIISHMSKLYYLSSKKQRRPPPSLSAWHRYHFFQTQGITGDFINLSLLYNITFLLELKVQTGFQYSDSLQNGVYSTTKIRSFSSIKFKFM